MLEKIILKRKYTLVHFYANPTSKSEVNKNDRSKFQFLMPRYPWPEDFRKQYPATPRKTGQGMSLPAFFSNSLVFHSYLPFHSLYLGWDQVPWAWLTFLKDVSHEGLPMILSEGMSHLLMVPWCLRYPCPHFISTKLLSCSLTIMRYRCPCQQC